MDKKHVRIAAPVGYLPEGGCQVLRLLAGIGENKALFVGRAVVYILKSGVERGVADGIIRCFGSGRFIFAGGGFSDGGELFVPAFRLVGGVALDVEMLHSEPP